MARSNARYEIEELARLQSEEVHIGFVVDQVEENTFYQASGTLKYKDGDTDIRLSDYGNMFSRFLTANLYKGLNIADNFEQWVTFEYEAKKASVDAAVKNIGNANV